MKLPAAAARAVPAVPLCRKGFSLRMIAVVVAAVTAWEVLGVMTGLHDPVDDLLFAAQGKKRRSSHRSGPGPDSSSSSSSSARQQQLSGQNLLTGAQRDSDELTAEQMARLAVAWEASAPDTTRARTAPTDVRSQLHAPGGETTALGGPGPPPLPRQPPSPPPQSSGTTTTGVAAVDYLVVNLHIYNQERAGILMSSVTNAKQTHIPDYVFEIRRTRWWKSLHLYNMPGLVLHDGSYDDAQDSAHVHFERIPDACFQDISHKNSLHPLELRWFVVDCVFDQMFAKHDYIALTDLGDVEFLKDLGPLFQHHSDRNLFLLQETSIHHSFQQTRFEACYDDRNLIGDSIPFNGGFQAGESRTIRKLARAVIAEFQHFIKAERQYCLELAPDQAVLNKVVFGDIDAWKPYTAGELHPPYAQPICTGDAHRDYYVLHKNKLRPDASQAHCEALLKQALAKVGLEATSER